MSRPKDKNITPTIAAISKIDFSGNMVPREWNHYIRRDSGKVDLNAVFILAEIVYWYRPTRIDDERTGALLRYERKFAADKLQVSRKSWAHRLGLSLKQVDTALANLKRLGLITTELRHIESLGRTLNNVLFVEPVPEAIAQISVLQDPNALLEEDDAFEYDDTEPDETEDDDPSPVDGTPSRLEATPYRLEERGSRPEARESIPEARESRPQGET